MSGFDAFAARLPVGRLENALILLAFDAFDAFDGLARDARVQCTSAISKSAYARAYKQPSNASNESKSLKDKGFFAHGIVKSLANAANHKLEVGHGDRETCNFLS